MSAGDTTRFDRSYYAEHSTDSDRMALWYYARAIRASQAPPGPLLDFGCGTGHLLKRLQAHFSCYGYDPSPYAREQCRSNAAQAVILDDWQEIPEASLGVVVALHCLEHISQPQLVVEGLARRLGRGGLFFAVVPNPEGLGHRLKKADWFAYRDPTHCSLLSRREWTRILRDVGLHVESVHGDGMWDAPYVRVVPALVQRALFGAPAAVQVFSPWARPFLPPFLGECLILKARRKG